MQVELLVGPSRESGNLNRKEDEKEGKNFRNNVARFDRLNVKQGINEAAKRGG